MSNIEKSEEIKLKEAEESKKVMLKLVKEGKLPEPRPLTRKERKELDNNGMNLFKIKENDKRTFSQMREDTTDYILNTIYKDFDFDDLPNNVCLWFGQYVFGITYKDQLAEKNS